MDRNERAVRMWNTAPIKVQFIPGLFTIDSGAV